MIFIIYIPCRNWVKMYNEWKTVFIKNIISPGGRKGTVEEARIETARGRQARRGKQQNRNLKLVLNTRFQSIVVPYFYFLNFHIDVRCRLQFWNGLKLPIFIFDELIIKCACVDLFLIVAMQPTWARPKPVQEYI